MNLYGEEAAFELAVYVGAKDCASLVSLGPTTSAFQITKDSSEAVASERLPAHIFGSYSFPLSCGLSFSAWSRFSHGAVSDPANDLTKRCSEPRDTANACDFLDG